MKPEKDTRVLAARIKNADVDAILDFAHENGLSTSSLMKLFATAIKEDRVKVEEEKLILKS